ncbi:AAA family ATPase [Sphingomonas bacterium]|uniref:AAA family ATPase n=1 Tax=Sphingomonas bacterium TaxID=1895847 RepID=UPI0015759CAE|nr:AAA family ATPase [Sphingomonas bacterium]
MTRRINPDDFLETAGEGRVWSPERDAAAWECAFAALDSALSDATLPLNRVVIVCGLQGAGKSTWIDRQRPDQGVIYFDAALPGIRHRKPIIQMAQRYHVPVEAIWIRIPLTIALERNRRRDPDKIVPEDSIYSVERQFEEPTLAEGLSRVSMVVP